jgi:hypothetical protein
MALQQSRHHGILARNCTIGRAIHSWRLALQPRTGLPIASKPLQNGGRLLLLVVVFHTPVEAWEQVPFLRFCPNARQFWKSKYDDQLLLLLLLQTIMTTVVEATILCKQTLKLEDKNASVYSRESEHFNKKFDSCTFFD